MMPKRAAVTRPQPDEYAPYYETYVSLIPGDDIVGVLEAQRVQMAQLLAARSEREGNFRYAPEKWSVKEVIGHICDAERIFAYRLLRIARGDQTPLASFEQNDYIAPGGVRRADTGGFGGGICGSASGDDGTGAEFEGGGVGTSRHGQRENRFSASAGVHYCRA